MFRTFTVVAVFVSTISAAQAGDVVAVHYGDLNLTNANDTGILAGRLYAVAELRCAALKPDPGYQSLFYKSGYKSCLDRVSKATSAKVMAVAGEPRRFASK
jgi:UrcA family protein